MLAYARSSIFQRFPCLPARRSVAMKYSESRAGRGDMGSESCADSSPVLRRALLASLGTVPLLSCLPASAARLRSPEDMSIAGATIGP